MTRGTQLVSTLRRPETILRRSVMLFVLLQLALAFGLAACGGDGAPPEQTLASLGSEVGQSKMDETDFPALLADFTVPEFATDTEAGLANYQLYLTGKAAQLALNEPEPPDLVEMDKEERSGSTRVSFNFTRKEGLFAVADISKIDVELVETENTANPWRIRRITLAR